MRNTVLDKAARASVDDLQALAAQGVQRALAVRMTELSSEQAQQVGGGLSVAAFDDYCGSGLRPFPKITGGGTLGGDVIIINGKFPNATFGF